jgi:hypothetical protein
LIRIDGFKSKTKQQRQNASPSKRFAKRFEMSIFYYLHDPMNFVVVLNFVCIKNNQEQIERLG